jgi:hypothetical protein
MVAELAEVAAVVGMIPDPDVWEQGNSDWEAAWAAICQAKSRGDKLIVCSFDKRSQVELTVSLFLC